MFIPNYLIRYVGESFNEDSKRMMFNWDDFQIRMKDYYWLEQSTDPKMCNFRINRFKVLLFDVKYINLIFENYYKIVVLRRERFNFRDSLNIIKIMRGLEILGKTREEYHNNISNGKIDSRFSGDIHIAIENRDDYDAHYKMTTSMYEDACYELSRLSGLKSIRNFDIFKYFPKNVCGFNDVEYISFNYLYPIHKNDNSFKQLERIDYFFHFYVSPDSIRGLEHSQLVKSIRVHTCDLSDLENMTNLTHIYAYGEDITINKTVHFNSLIYLEFHSFFDSSIDNLVNCKQLKYLIFGYGFNKPIDVLENLTELRVIKFGTQFNQSIKKLFNLPNLRSLTLPRSFSQMDRSRFSPKVRIYFE